MKRIIAITILTVLILQLGIVGLAANISGAVEYKPADIVVVFDISGSMNTSDPTHMTASAIDVLVDMIPINKNRVGLVAFNTKATSLLTDASGNPVLLDLENFENIKTIDDKVLQMTYNSGTGIGNAIKLATDILAQQSTDSDRKKAIILFTDGMDDFGSNGQLALARCKENQSTAIQWATQNECPIYCIGYDYKNSMGANGEGITKLESIANSTGGRAKALTNIKQIENMFISILEEIFGVTYINVGTCPGDGSRHEIDIPIGPEVVEANIRIACATEGAVPGGTIELYNPTAEKVMLHNGNGIRYDVDALAANIKITAPKTGTWKLVLNGIKGDEIKIGLLKHYELGINSELILPQGNPDGVAYAGDEIGVQAFLTSGGNQISDTAVYQTIKNSRVIVTPRVAPEKQEIYALNFDGTKYVGSFPISYESVYDVTVELASDTFVRSDKLVIQSSNHPLVLDKQFENVKLNKKNQVIISDIYTYVSDPEQDTITAQVTNSTDPDMAKVEVKDDTIVIDGLGWGATNITVTFTDAHGNTVDSTFKVSVNDPVAWAIIIASLILIAAIILLLIYLAYKKTLIVGGTVHITELGTRSISLIGGIVETTPVFALDNFIQEEENHDFESSYSDGDIGDVSIESILGGTVEINLDIEESKEFDENAHHNQFESKINLKQYGCKNVYDILAVLAKMYEEHMTLNGGRESKMATDVRQFVEGNLGALRDISILGTRFGRQGIIFKLAKNSCVDKKGFNEDVYKTNTKVNDTTKNIEFAAPTQNSDDDGNKIFVYVKFDYKNAN